MLAEMGHNRDNENLEQINLCMLFGQKSRLPVYQTIYSGSLNDVVTLETTLNEFLAISKAKSLQIVMDKGFFSRKNVNMLDEKHVKFLISVPFTTKFAKNFIDEARENINHIRQAIVTSTIPIRGAYKHYLWGNNGIYLHAHIYFDPQKELNIRNELYQRVIDLKKSVENEPHNKVDWDDVNKYYSVTESNKTKLGYTLKLLPEVIDAELKTAGWFVLISNHIRDTQKAHSIYTLKDVVEKGFWKYKNSLGLRRLRVHSDQRTLNKSFIAFIALILSSAIHNTMKEHSMYKRLTFDKLNLKLNNIMSATINGNRFVRAITKEQKEIFTNFSMPVPDSSTVL
jgi:transposase